MAKTQSEIELKTDSKPEIKQEPQRAIGELVNQIESLTGLQKQEFCKKLTDSEKKAVLAYVKSRDMEEVECIFRCHEPPGGSVTLTCRPFEGCEYTNTFVDGQVYKIPLYLAKRMNSQYQGCGTWYPTHAHIMDVNGKPIVTENKKNYRFSFNSSQFA